MYKLVVKSFDGEKLQDAIKAAKMDNDNIDSEMKQKEQDMVIQKKNRLRIIEQLQGYEGIELIKDGLPKYKRCVDDKVRLHGMLSKLDTISEQIQVLDITIESMQVITKVHTALQKVKEAHALLNTLSVLNLKLGNVQGQYSILEKRLSYYTELLSFDETAYLKAVRDLKHTLDLNNYVLDIQTKLQWRVRMLDTLSEIPDIEKLKKGVVLYKELLQHKNSIDSVTDRIGTIDVKMLESIEKLGSGLIKLADYGVLVRYEERIQLLCSQLQRLEDDVEESNSTLSELEYARDNGICIYCKNKINQ
jgi:hypothetical protein